jgi:hypothetical protein
MQPTITLIKADLEKLQAALITHESTVQMLKEKIASHEAALKILEK